jgi:tetratricopeptide (TPR) repeat protein
VLKLAPTDLSALSRLARLYEREQQWASAVEVLKQLAELEPDPDQIRQHRFDLAKAFEKLGQPREAEATLEAARREAPTDLVIVRALAEFYRRHDAQSALAMHLNRAVKDLRHALDADLTDASAWEALVEVFGWRARRDAARVTAAAAQAFGVVLGDDAAQAGAGGVAPGAGAAAAAPEVVELLASASVLSPAARQVFAMAGDALDKTVPALDLKASRAERVSLRDLPFRAQLEELARAFGASEVEVWVTPGAPRACSAIGSQPVTLLVGRDLLAPGFDAAERAFLLARALEVARLNLVAAGRAQPADLAIAVAGMMRHFDPTHAPPGVSAAALDEAAKRFGKALPRKVRDELFPLVCEMMGAPSFDALRLGAATAELADRVALLATGAVPSAVSALLWSAAAETSVRDPRRADAVRRVASARALVAFAISDLHFEARQLTGVDWR